MPVYTIATLTFIDMDAYRRYQAAFPAVFARHQGEVLIADEAPRTLEGASTIDKIVVLAFPNEAAAQAFASDPDYQRIAKDRKAGANASVWAVKGAQRHSAP